MHCARDPSQRIDCPAYVQTTHYDIIEGCGSARFLLRRPDVTSPFFLLCYEPLDVATSGLLDQVVLRNAIFHNGEQLLKDIMLYK